MSRDRNGVACRAARDCGVACLATLLAWHGEGMPYIHALCTLFKPSAELARADLSTSEYRMRRALGKLGWKLSRKRGVNETEGKAGLMLVRAPGEWNNNDSHWLAWERDEAGVVWVWNPANGGERFEYKPGALHNRGMRLTWWANVTRRVGG